MIRASLRSTALGLALLSAEPAAITLHGSESTPLTITALFSDGTSRDVTADPATVYASAPEGRLVVSATGLVTALDTPGAATVTATFRGQSIEVPVEVLAARSLLAIAIVPEQLVLAVILTKQLALIGTFDDGSVKDLAGDPGTTWRSSLTRVGFVDETGLLRAGSLGEAVITASHSGLSAVASLRVIEGDLVGLELIPDRLNLRIGEDFVLALIARFAGGEVLDVTAHAEVLYDSDKPDIVKVSPVGVVTGLTAGGPVMIYARFGGLLAVSRLTVRAIDEGPVALRVVPSVASMRPGETLALTVFAVYADGREVDVTAAAAGTTYSASATDVMEVDANGGLRAVADGAAQIKVVLGELFALVDVSVSSGPRRLVSLEAGPNVLGQVGGSFALTVIGVFSDGSRADVTAASTGTTYQSGDASVLQVSPDGRLTLVAPGTTLVTIRNGAVATTVTVEVARPPPTLVSIEATPGDLLLQIAESAPLRVLATWSDGTSRDVTADPSTVYASSAADLARADSSGRITAVAAGDVTIRVEFGGLFALVSVRVTASLSVVAIEVTPSTASLAVGATQQLRVTALMSDGTKRDVTAASDTIWTTSSMTIASVSPGGLVTALGAGAARITILHGGQSVTAAITVQAPRTLVSISVSPAVDTLAPGGTRQLAVKGVYSDGTSADLTAASTGTTYAPGGFVSVVGVSADGLVTALLPGSAIVTITNSGKTATAAFTVSSSTRTLVSISVAPTLLTLAPGGTQALAVTGNYSDGTTSDLTAVSTGTTYTMSAPGLVSVGAGGLLTALSAGSVTVTVRNGTKSDTVAVTVTSPVTLVSLLVSPATDTLAMGATLQLKVTGVYSDGTIADLTAASTGTTYGATSILFVTVAADGLVTARLPGTAVITVKNGARSTTSTITVQSPRTLVSIAATPAPLTLAVGATQQLVVTGTWSDSTTADLTQGSSGTLYSAPSLGVVAVSANGLVTALAPGVALLTVRNGVRSTTVTITVPNPRILVAIKVSPITASLAIGATEPLVVTGSYSDNTIADLTAASSGTTYVAVPPGVVSVSADGLVTALAAGSATITVKNGLRSATATITVQSPVTLVSLAITPATLTLASGATAPLTVTATYSDGRTADVTEASTGTTYSTSPTGIVAVGADGLVTALASGTSVITATNAGRSATASVTVTSKILISLTLSPVNFRLAAGSTMPVTLTANWNDGTTQDVSAASFGTTWSMSAPGVASVSADGLVLGVAAGTTTLRADFGGKSVTTLVAVTPVLNPVIALVLTPNPVTLAKGKTAQLVLTGIRQNGATVILTNDPGTTYLSSAPGVATVSASGLVTAVSPGTATITASYLALKATITVTVTAPILASIAVAPTALSIEQAGTATVTVTATYDDGSTANVTADSGILYISGNPAVTTAAAGTVTGVGVGVTTIVVLFGGRTALLAVTVVGSPGTELEFAL